MSLGTKRGSSGVGVSPSTGNFYLYNKGTLGVPFDTENQYHNGSTTPAVFPQFYTNYVRLPQGLCITGTSEKVDLTNYKTIKIRAKVNGNYQALFVTTEKNIDNQYRAALVSFTYSEQYTEYSVDVSSLTGSYYICLDSLGTSGYYVEFDELWLEKNDDMPLPAKSIEFEEWLHQSASHQIEITKDVINVVAPASAGWITWATKEMWDFTGYNKLIVRGTISNYSSNDLVFGYDITQSKSTAEWWYSAPAYTTKRNNGAFSLTLDISSRTGSYYIAFAAASFNVQIDHVLLAQ